MRKAMICVGVMLTMLQLWPMIFGHDASQAIAAEAIGTGTTSGAQNVAVLPIPRSAAAQSRTNPPMESCLRVYRHALDACRAGDGACRLQTSDRWQVCEATGF
jgi:hypothetical protein